MQKPLIWLKYWLRRHGTFGLMRAAGHNIRLYLTKPKTKARALGQAESFDEKHGTDTSGIREVRTLDFLGSAAAPYAVRYGPSNAQSVRTIIENLSLDYRRYCFIDYGSGKGKVLFIAASYPFMEVVGVELSYQLHETALQNIARLPTDVAQCRKVTSVCGDAALFALPRSNLVCYLYNPFGGPIITAVVMRLVAHYKEYGYEVIVIYSDPQHRDIFEKTGTFTVVHDADEIVILRTPTGSDLAPLLPEYRQPRALSRERLS